MIEFSTPFDSSNFDKCFEGENSFNSDEIPDFYEEHYKSILQYIRINFQNVKPSFSIQKGKRTDTLFFGKKENCLGKILINYGPVENFKLSKVIDDGKGKVSKNRREFVEICLQSGCGVYLDVDADVDIIMSGNPKREIIQKEIKVNNKRQKYIHNTKVTRIRPTTYESRVVVIDLFINMESELVKNLQMDSEFEFREGIGGTSEEKPYGLLEEPEYDPDKVVVRV